MPTPPLGSVTFYGTPGNNVVNGSLNNPNAFIDYGLGVDVLTGGRENDLFAFSAVDPWLDLIDGGAGRDVVDYSSVYHGLMINLADGTTRAWAPSWVSGPYQLLTNIEDVVGTQWNDIIVGNHLDNVLEGGGGSDVLDGGAGDDTASYANSVMGVTVALDGHGPVSILPSEAVGDILISIENVIGSDYGDQFYGSPADNTFDGRDGIDRVSYRYVTGREGVHVDLNDGTVQGGQSVGTDRLISIEQIEGTRNDDTYIGNDNRSDTFVFSRYIGADTIDGFNANANSDDHDLIRFEGEGVFKNWDELENHLYDTGNDEWTIRIDEQNSITLTNVQGDLNENDFYFFYVV